MADTIIVSKALVIDADENVLVLRRSSTHPNRALCPDLPGGQVDNEEDAHRAVSREVHEETGLTIAHRQFHLLYAVTTFSNNTNLVRHLLAVRLTEKQPTVQLSWEHDQAEWVPLAEVAKKLNHPLYGQAVEYILTHQLLPAKQ